jgi:hypothetical protein
MSTTKGRLRAANGRVRSVRGWRACQCGSPEAEQSRRAPSPPLIMPLHCVCPLRLECLRTPVEVVRGNAGSAGIVCRHRRASVTPSLYCSEALSSSIRPIGSLLACHSATRRMTHFCMEGLRPDRNISRRHGKQTLCSGAIFPQFLAIRSAIRPLRLGRRHRSSTCLT